jgi:hypothetical protein
MSLVLTQSGQLPPPPPALIPVALIHRRPHGEVEELKQLLKGQ